jgi:alkylated DNA nucleotide flippase Atl1
VPGRDREEYVEAVLALAEQVPPGRVTTYGTIADALGVGGPRQVGQVMATHGGAVPWWRVVRADGSLPDRHRAEALAGYRAEGTPLRPSGRPDLAAAYWAPEQQR